VRLGLPALLILVGFQSAAPILGGRLRTGMQLVYSSNGIETPWLVVSANADSVVAEGRRCLSVRLRLNPADTAITSRIQCADGKQMLAGSAASGALQPARPLDAGELVMVRPGRTRYVSRSLEFDTIGGVGYAVVPTIVEFIDGGGRVARRLRERFAIELATATCGVFEVAEGTGFRTERQFMLAAVVNPGEIRPTPAANPQSIPPTPKC
jgi:hypothetical protein